MFKAAIFDMDGVIIDSEPMHARAAVLALKKYNIDISIEYAYRFIGSTTYHMCQRMVEDFSLSITPEELLRANDEMKDYLLKTEGHTIIPYIKDVMRDLHSHNIKLIIASSSPAAAIEEVMSSLDIKQYFEGYVSGMQVARPKPAPDIFLAAAKKLMVDPNDCIVIEDSANGVNAAFAAGITSIGFINPNSGEQDLSNAAILVEGFDEVDFDFILKVYQQAHMEPAMIATTERLIIRELSIEDMDELCRIYKKPEVNKFLDEIMESPDLEKEKHIAYIKNIYHYYGFGLWGVYLKEDGRLIGRCGIEYKSIDQSEEYEIGYLIATEYQGQGFALECVKAVIDYAFDKLDVPSIVAIIDKSNLRSVKLAEKAEMLRNGEYIRGNRSCYKYYAIKSKD